MSEAELAEDWRDSPWGCALRAGLVLTLIAFGGLACIWFADYFGFGSFNVGRVKAGPDGGIKKFLEAKIGVPQTWALLIMVAFFTAIFALAKLVGEKEDESNSWTEATAQFHQFAAALVLAVFIPVLALSLLGLVFGRTLLSIIESLLVYWFISALVWLALTYIREAAQRIRADRLGAMKRRIKKKAYIRVRAERLEAAVQRHMSRLRAERSEPGPSEDATSKPDED